MEFKADKIDKKIIIMITMINLLLSPSLLRAEDYPAGYMGPGYREYLQGKIRDGYHIEVFKDLEGRQKEETNKRNQIEEIVSNSYQANVHSHNGIGELNEQKTKNSQILTQTAEQERKHTEDVASTLTEFRYFPSSDGKITYFKDGLASRIENEPALDEFGNMGRKNTYNMQYNDKRLLTSYEASLKDNLGNVSYIYCSGITYTPDSVFYADDKTSANKNEREKYIKEVDSAGNVKLTHWQALSFEGKKVSAFSQTIEDSVYGTTSFTQSNIKYADDNPSAYHEEGIGTDGLYYSLDKTNIAYNDKHQAASYHEEKTTTHLDGGQIKTIVDAQIKYLANSQQSGPDVEEPTPDKLLESTITTTTIHPDGSKQTETVTTHYNYGADGQISSALGEVVSSGQEADWWEYTDTTGHTLSRKEDKDGNVTFTYINSETQETVIVPEYQVTAILKDGNNYSGTSLIQFEIVGGKPMSLQTHAVVSYYHPESLDLLRTEDTTIIYTNGLVNNLPRVLSAEGHTEVIYAQCDNKGNHQKETRDITTNYIYAENGNLLDAEGLGKSFGYELTDEGWREYTGEIKVDYEVILGETKQEKYKEDRRYEITNKVKELSK